MPPADPPRPLPRQSDLDFLNTSLAQTTPQQNTTETSPEPTEPATAPPLPTLPDTSPLAPLFNSLSLSLQSVPTGAELDQLDEAAVMELLRKMDQAEHAADGLEGRLDELLGSLDGMLGALGGLDVGDGEESAGEEEDEEDEEEAGSEEVEKPATGAKVNGTT